MMMVPEFQEKYPPIPASPALSSERTVEVLQTKRKLPKIPDNKIPKENEGKKYKWVADRSTRKYEESTRKSMVTKKKRRTIDIPTETGRGERRRSERQ